MNVRTLIEFAAIGCHRVAMVSLLCMALATSSIAQQAPADEAAALNRQAVQFYVQGRYAEAEPLFKRSLAIRERALGPEHPEFATSLNNLGEVYREQGRFAEAEPLYRRSLTIKEKVLGLDHPQVARSLKGLGEILDEQGRDAEAASLYRRSLAILEKAHGPEHPDVAAMTSFVASSIESQGRYVEAEQLYRRVLAIYEKAFGPEHVNVAGALSSLGILYRKQDRFDEAELLHKRSLAIREKALGSEHPDVAVTLANLARLYWERRRYAEAEPLYKRSLSIRERALGSAHPDVAASLASIAVMAEQRGHIDEALANIRRAVAIRERRASEPAGSDTTANDAERLNYRRYFVAHLSIATKYARTSPAHKADVIAESFQVAQLASRSSADRALAQAAVRFALGNDTRAQAVRERQDAIGRRNRLDKALVAAASQPPEKRDAAGEQAMREELHDINMRVDAIDGKLRAEFPEFADLSQSKPLALAEAQRLLAPDEAMIAFVVDDDASYRFILRRDRADLRIIEIKRDDLDYVAKMMRESMHPSGMGRLADLPSFDAETAYQLYDLLFLDSAPLIAGAKHLLFVLDGSLSGIPFSALPTKSPPDDAYSFGGYRRVDWLARDYAVTVLPSVGSLRALRVFAAATQVPREPFLGFGDPDLKGSPGEVRGKAVARLAARGPVADVALVRELDPLPDSRQELERIARSLKADSRTVHVRGRATERRVKTTDLSKYRVLAFATHGLMAGQFDGYAEPALVLTPPATGDAVDDGLLGASEVAQLKLNADWVILSACNTAAADGTPGAEGLSGLARAFFYAGSRTLLVSHWPVLSDASVRLTTGAIEALAKDSSIGRAEALRRAMMAMLDDTALPLEYAHPAIWAPFSLVGEGGPGR